MFDTPEEKAALKEQIDASVAAAIASTQASVDKLTANNAALKTELRAAQKGAEIDPAKYAALEDKFADLTATLSTTEGSLKKAQTDAEKTVKQLTIPNSPIYRNDIGLRLEGQLTELQEMGYATEWDWD